MLIGWDISTAVMGICVKHNDTHCEFLFRKIVGATHLIKHQHVVKLIDEFLVGRPGPHVHVVEDRLGGFTGGLTTKQTLMSLAAVNAVASLQLSHTGQVIHLAPVTVKSIVGLVVPKGVPNGKKIAAVGLVRSRHANFPYSETSGGNWAVGTDDMADAWLLAEAGSKILSGEKVIGPKKKAARRKGKVGRGEAGGAPEGRVRVPVPKARVRQPKVEQG